MRKSTATRTFLWQIFITFIVLLTVYMVYAAIENTLPSQLSRFSFFILQSFYATITAAVTIAACLVLGLPIRIISRCNQWWQNKPLIPLLGVAIGSTFLLMSFAPYFCDIHKVFQNGNPIEKRVPNSSLALGGWFLTAFSLLHLYPRSVIHLFKRHSI